jgi:chorismate synthase
MAGSTFGHLFRVTTFGESHGAGLGVVVDGATPGVELAEADIQQKLDRRRPGQSEITTKRNERDVVHVLSGLFEGRTTGTPLMMILYNEDVRSQDYAAIRHLFRPGHADLTYLRKYGIRDYRGSGRASGRETAARVAAGAVASRLLAGRGVSVLAYVINIGGVQCQGFDPAEIERNPVRACDGQAAAVMKEKIQEAQEKKDSLGGIVECRVGGVPAGLGEPVFDKLDAELAHAMLSIGAVKGIEFGAGFRAASMWGHEHNDPIGPRGFLSNNAGGILGGISTGEEILFRVVVKPTSSIALPQQTIDIQGAPRTIVTEGRHDPSICPRVVPVVEAMAAIVLEDHFKRQASLHA